MELRPNSKSPERVKSPSLLEEKHSKSQSPRKSPNRVRSPQQASNFSSRSVSPVKRPIAAEVSPGGALDEVAWNLSHLIDQVKRPSLETPPPGPAGPSLPAKTRADSGLPAPSAQRFVQVPDQSAEETSQQILLPVRRTSGAGLEGFGRQVQPKTPPQTSTTPAEDSHGGGLGHWLMKWAESGSSSSPMTTAVAVSLTRQRTLPPKSKEEDEKHQREFIAMMQAAQEREKQRKRQEEKSAVAREARMAAALSMWRKDILPHWTRMVNMRRFTDLVGQGIPTQVRGQVWLRCLGELGLFDDTQADLDYDSCTTRASQLLPPCGPDEETSNEHATSPILHVRRASTTADPVELVYAPSAIQARAVMTAELDEIYPKQGLYARGAPYRGALRRVLDAVICCSLTCRQGCRYPNGLAWCGGMIMLYMIGKDAFGALVRLLRRESMHGAFMYNESNTMHGYSKLFHVLLEEHLPKLAQLFSKLDLHPSMYLYDWIRTVYGRLLPLEMVARIWDLYMTQGDLLLLRVALALLSLFESDLLDQNAETVLTDLKKLPRRLQGTDDAAMTVFFSELERIVISEKRYHSLLLQHVGQGVEPLWPGLLPETIRPVLSSTVRPLPTRHVYSAQENANSTPALSSKAAVTENNSNSSHEPKLTGVHLSPVQEPNEDGAL